MMWFKQKGMCSWSSVTIIASIVTLVSVVHLFLYPVVPSLDYFRQYENSCIPINSTYKSTHNNIISNQTKFPLDLHNGVVYRGAPWKNEVGQWLAGCDSITSLVKVIEHIGGKSCRNDCSGQGICNRELGQCRCFHGFTGQECAERQELSCNYPGSKEQPFGHWVVSICPAYCDTTRAILRRLLCPAHSSLT